MQYNALESLQAFELGQGQRKERERETAMKGIGNALAGGDIAGATSQAFKVDPMYGMQLQQYGDQRNALDLRKKVGGLVGAGDRKSAASMAYEAGEFEMGASIDAQIAQMTQQQREDALFLSSELGNAALTLQGITDPQQRAAQWQQMQGRFVNDFGMDPAALAQFNPMDDMALQRAIGEAQSFSDRLSGQRYDAERAYAEKVDTRNFNRGVYEFDTTREDAKAAAQAKAEADAAAANPAGLTEDQIKLEVDLSNRWAPMQANFSDIQQQFSRVNVLGAETKPDGTPMDPAQRAVNDLALVVAFTKMLDPGSVAREGEVELTKKSASLLGEAQTWLPRLQKGGTLLPEATRKALVDAAKDMMPAYERAYQKLANDNVGRLNAYGLDPSRVMLGYEFAPPVADAVTAPEVGMEEDGFVYMGGNPADPNSWKKKEAGSDFRFFNTPGVR